MSAVRVNRILNTFRESLGPACRVFPFWLFGPAGRDIMSAMTRRTLLASAVALPLRLSGFDVARPAAKALHLKITGAKTFIINAGTVNWVYCKIYTDQGLVGLGEGSVTSKEATVAQAIMEHERFLIGKDPTDIEFLWQAMFRYPRWRGGPILNSAVSAVEIALWDITGQALGVPI